MAERWPRESNLQENDSRIVAVWTRKPSWRQGYARQRRHSRMAAVPRWPSAAILDIIEPEIAPFDPPNLKTVA